MGILIIVVIYNKSIKNLEYLNLIQNADILIYDNSIDSQDAPQQMHYFHNPFNGGVSAAYNYGVELAKEMDKDFIILLDQDTNFSEQILDLYIEYANRFGEKYIYAPIIKKENKVYSPFIEGKNKNYCQDINNLNYENTYNIKGKSVINSGLMIPLTIFQDIGNFNEQIKLDFSDIYFIEKYKRKQKNIILIDAYLEHSLSGDEGKNRQKELNRFKFYCNGAREYKKTTKNVYRINRMVFFRMIRLIIKYITVAPISIYVEYYLGEKII